MRAYSEGLLSIPDHLQNSPFLAGKDGKVTYGQFLHRMNKAVSTIHNIIPTRQNIVFVDADSTVSFVIALFALNLLAQIAVPISPTYALGELRLLYEVYKPVLTISDAVESACEFAGTRLLSCSNIESSSYEDDINILPVTHNKEDVCFILFTSGSQGLPKGVVLTNNNIVSDIAGVQAYMGLSIMDKCLITRSLGHASALVAELLLASLTQGSCVLHGKPTTIRSLFDRCESEGITWLGVPPVLLRRIVDYGKLAGRQFMPKIVVVSGSILSRDLCLDFLETFPSTKLINAYGLTEASPRVSYLDGPLASTKPGSAGYPIQGCRLRVVNANGIECQPLEVGEVHIAGENIMKGYFLSESPQHNIKEGFLRTGDSGYLDQDGALFIVGRMDAMVTYNGINVYPEYINSVIERSEIVLQAETLLVWTAGSGEKLVTFVEINENVGKSEALRSIRNHLSENIDRRIIPDDIVVIDGFPLTLSGKVDKQLLKDSYHS